MHSATLLLAQHYLLALFIIFFIGTLGGKLAEKLGLPDVAIFILLGIALGPSMLAVLGAYLLAEQIHASGFMSVFVAGLMLGNAKSLRLTVLPKEEHAAHQFIDAVSLKLLYARIHFIGQSS